MSPLLYYIAIFAFGAIIGSFLNVCICRIPAGQSVISPASRCPLCCSAIRWYQNVPVISYLLLRGRCGNCGAAISKRYPLVEALTGMLFVWIYLRFGWQFATPVYWVFVAALVAITFIDLDHQIIPDVISLSGIVVGFLTVFLIPWLAWYDSLLGILLGGGSLWLVAEVYHRLTGQEGMGGGDIKLLAMMGAFLGWKAVLPVIFFGSLAGSLVGVPLMWIRRADGKLAIPFGPFLALGGLVYLLWGKQLLVWYLGLCQR